MDPGIDDITDGYLPPAYGGSARGGRSNVLTSGRPASQSRAPLLGSARQRDEVVQSRWPLRSHIALGALPGAVPSARLHTRHVLWEWGQKSLADDAELIVSELTTNAVTATQTICSLHPVCLWLLSDGSRTLTLVGDANPHPPIRIGPNEEEADGGRGLLLVEALSCNWGWYLTHGLNVTKVVWAELRMPYKRGQAGDGSSDAHGRSAPWRAAGLSGLAAREQCQQAAPDTARRPGTAQYRP